MERFKIKCALSFGSVILGALIKVVSANFLLNIAYDIINPMVNGIRTNFKGWEFYGNAWFT